MSKTQRLYLLGFILSLAFLGTTLYLQFGLGIQPCPLCILQRICMILLCLTFFIALLHKPNNIGHLVYGGLIAIFAILGMTTAGRQIYLQQQHIFNAVCSTASYDFQTLITSHPLPVAIKMIFQGTSKCGEVAYKIAGIPISVWSLIAFCIFGASGLLKIFRK